MTKSKWEKYWESSEKDWITYIVNKTGERVDILKIKIGAGEIRWEVRINNNLDKAKLFKTKSQALSFAKQYMRTH